jgi:hypothetical protein
LRATAPIARVHDKCLNDSALPFKLALFSTVNVMKPRDIFGLGVRLLGLVFLYFGLRAVSPMLDLDVIENPDKNEIINDLLPVVFNLVIALVLLRGGFLMRWAYPETSKIELSSKNLENLSSQPKRVITAPEVITEPSAPAKSTGMERADAKLAALVEKPK